MSETDKLKTSRIIEEIKANPELNAIYTKAVKRQMLEDDEIELILPFLPEFRESMERAEQSEGRTTRLEDAQAALRKLDASMVRNLPIAVLEDLKLLVDYCLATLSYEEDPDLLGIIGATAWFDQVVREGLSHAEEPY